MKKLKFVALMAAILTAQVQAKTLTIGLDVSGSNPLISDKAFSENAAVHAANQIAALKSGDVVRVMTFGDRASAKNLERSEYKVSKRSRAEEIAKKVGGYILDLPDRTEGGQQQTNLVGWLELTGGFDCKSGSSILVFTDGLEASATFNPKEFLSGKLKLPKPDVQLEGCEVVFYGLGVGWALDQVKTVRNEWREYFRAAGAGFEPVTP